MSEYRVAIRKVIWSEVIKPIADAGYSPQKIADKTIMSAPTVRLLAKDKTEPSYSQGQRLIAMRNAVLRGQL